MSSPCKNCNETGLAGSGESPWLHHGSLTTCPKCQGTGKVSDESGAEPTPEAPAAEEVAPVDEPAPVEEVAPVEEAPAPVEEAPVDNASAEEVQPSGILERAMNAVLG